MTRHLRNALRVATRWPLYFWSVVVILALGVCANTAVFAAVRALLIDPPPYSNPDAVLVLRQVDHFAPAPLAASDIPELEQLRGLAQVAGCSAPSVPLLGSRPSVLAVPIEVTHAFFQLFALPPLMGRALVASDFQSGQRSAVLSFELWNSMFGGNPDVVGRFVTLGHTRWTIVGVMPRAFQPRCFEIDGPVAWVPHDPAISAVTGYGLMMLARRAPGFSLAQVNAEHDALAKYWASHRGDARLAAYVWEPANASRAAAARPGLMLVQSVAVLLLLVACTNIAGALLVNASERRSEFALRVSLGATPGQLARQVLGETGAVAAFGVTLGAGLALAVITSLGSLAAPVLSGVALGMGWRDLLAALALGGVALIVFGAFPALVTASGSGIGSSASTSRHPSAHRLRAILLGLQVSATIVLLTGATVLLRSYRSAMSSAPGFQSEGLLTTDIYLPTTTGAASSFQEAIRSLRAAMEDITFVDEVAFSDASPFGSGCGSRRLEVLPPGKTAAVMRSFRVCHVSSNYFSLLHIPIVRGRVSASDTADLTDVVVNEAFARTLPGDEVLGAVVRTPSRSLRITGVVGDVKGTWLTTGSPPELYAPIALAASTAVSVTARSWRLPEAAAEMRKAIERAAPNGPSVAIEPLSQIVWRSEERRRFYLAIAGTFAVVAALVSALGIFTAVGRVVAVRSRDIAIRVALGARRSEVVRLVLFEGLQPVMIGTVAGLAGGVALVRIFASHPFLQTLLFKVASTDLSTYALPLTVVLANAVLACLVPLGRALRLNPATTLKAE
jgi:putative ABC transport system permease protein